MSGACWGGRDGGWAKLGELSEVDFSISAARLLNDAEILGIALDRVCKKWGIEVKRVDEIDVPQLPRNYWPVILGYAGGNLIRLRNDLGELSPEHLSVWVHEIAHEFLHYTDLGLSGVIRHIDPLEYWEGGTDSVTSVYSQTLPAETYRTNRVGYRTSPSCVWEMEAESVAMHFFRRVGMMRARLAKHYRTVEEDGLTDAQRVVLRMLVSRFHAVKQAGLKTGADIWNIVPAAPCYQAESTEDTISLANEPSGTV